MFLSCSIDFKCSLWEEKSIFSPCFSFPLFPVFFLHLAAQFPVPGFEKQCQGAGFRIDIECQRRFLLLENPSITDLALKSLFVLQLVSSSMFVASHCLCERRLIVLTKRQNYSSTITCYIFHSSCCKNIFMPDCSFNTSQI